jgi:hypothetical protein
MIIMLAVSMLFIIGCIVCFGAAIWFLVSLYTVIIEQIITTFKATEYIIRYASDYEGRQAAKRAIDDAEQ